MVSNQRNVMLLIRLFLLQQTCSSFQLLSPTAQRRQNGQLLVRPLSAETTSVAPSEVGKLWESIPMGPPDAILGIAQAFRDCQDPRKVNVCVGAYRDDAGKPWVLPSVRQAEQQLLADPNENKEYLPIEGDVKFIDCALRFAYGEDVDLTSIAGVQTLSGTGACRVGGEFLAQFLPGRPIYIPNPYVVANGWLVLMHMIIELTCLETPRHPPTCYAVMMVLI